MFQISQERDKQLNDLERDYAIAREGGFIWNASTINIKIGNVLMDCLHEQMKSVTGENDG